MRREYTAIVTAPFNGKNKVLITYVGSWGRQVWTQQIVQRPFDDHAVLAGMGWRATGPSRVTDNGSTVYPVEHVPDSVDELTKIWDELFEKED